MDALQGTTTTRELVLLEDGRPVDGRTIQYTLTSPTGTSLLTNAATVGAGNGRYTITLDGTQYLSQVGVYTERWTDTASGADLQVERKFVVGVLDGPLVTRLELRHWVATLLDDLWTGEVTQGSTTTLVDPARFEPDWRGYWVYVYAGQGAGQERRIVGIDTTTGTLQVSPAWRPPAANDRYELHRRHRVEAYNAAIDLAISQAAHQALLPITDESLVTSTGVIEYVIPAGFHLLAEVWQRGTGDWKQLTPDAYTVVPGRQLLRLPTVTGGMRLRLVGQMLPMPLAADSAYCDVRPDYVAFKAAAYLAASALSAASYDTDALAARLRVFLGEAEAVRPRIKPLPGSRRV